MSFFALFVLILFARRALLLSIQSMKKTTTTSQDAEIQEKRNVLRHCIRVWLEVRKTYIPTLPSLINSENTPELSNTTLLERIALKLPSALQPSARVLCLYGLPDKERRLRLAQVNDALSDLRRQLRITTGLWQYKKTQIGPSQRVTTQARVLINRFKEKTTRCAQRYRAAYAALLALDPNGEWRKWLKELKDEDIRGPGKGDDEAEGTRELSWIWLTGYNLESGVPVEFNKITDKDLIDGKSHCGFGIS